MRVTHDVNKMSHCVAYRELVVVDWCSVGQWRGAHWSVCRRHTAKPQSGTRATAGHRHTSRLSLLAINFRRYDIDTEMSPLLFTPYRHARAVKLLSIIIIKSSLARVGVRKGYFDLSDLGPCVGHLVAPIIMYFES